MVLPLLLSALAAAADQALKWWIVTNIAYQESIPLLPGFLDLTYERNTGGAWSILSDYTWLLTAISAAVVLVMLFALLRPLLRCPLGRWSLALALGGAVGNLIDRARLHYVVDMFRTTFIEFPVFNIADMCVVTGGILFCVYLIFFSENYEKGGSALRGYGSPVGRYRGRRRPR